VDVLQGGINAVRVQDGLKEVKGSVELYKSIYNPVEQLEAPFGGVTFVKEGQMIIRLLQDE
jgi:hypothetical protein